MDEMALLRFGASVEGGQAALHAHTHALSARLCAEFRYACGTPGWCARSWVTAPWHRHGPKGETSMDWTQIEVKWYAMARRVCSDFAGASDTSGDTPGWGNRRRSLPAAPTHAAR